MYQSDPEALSACNVMFVQSEAGRLILAHQISDKEVLFPECLSKDFKNGRGEDWCQFRIKEVVKVKWRSREAGFQVTTRPETRHISSRGEFHELQQSFIIQIMPCINNNLMEYEQCVLKQLPDYCLPLL